MTRGLGRDVDLAQDHAVDVVERGQQVPALATVHPGSAR